MAADGRTFAVRGADGLLAFHRIGSDTFATREWLAGDGDARNFRDRRLGEGIVCDPSGCIGKLADGRLVSYVLAPEAFEEDCRRAAVIVTTRQAPTDCAALVIARPLWRERGALTLRREGAGFVIDSARAPNFDRPWSAALPPRLAPAAVAPAAKSPSVRRDATPAPEAIEADDGLAQ